MEWAPAALQRTCFVLS